MRSRARILGLAVLCGAVVAAPATADLTPDGASAESARRGAEYLAGKQQDDGSIPGLGGSVQADQVAQAVVALLAGGGQDPAVARALDYIAAEADAFVGNSEKNGGHIGPVVSALVAAGEDPREFAGIDWVAELEKRRGDDGGYGGNIFGDSLAMLGRLAAGERLSDRSITRLRSNQCATGGWSFEEACARLPDTDTTSLAISVLAAAVGPGDLAVERARTWLLDTQNQSGCWGYSAQFPEDQANACGLAISAIVALGEDPSAPPWAEGARHPLTRLREFQLDSGGFKSSLGHKNADNYATFHAVPGMAHWSYPVSPPGTSPDPAPGTGDEDTGTGDGSSGTGDGRTTSTSRTSEGGPGAGASQERPDGGSDDDEPSRASSPSSVSTATTITRPGFAPVIGSPGSDDGAERTPATRRPPPGVATATFDDGDGGVGPVAAGVATGALGSVALGAGWYWRRRALTAGLTTGDDR